MDVKWLYGRKKYKWSPVIVKSNSAVSKVQKCPEALAPTTVVNPADGGGGEAVTAGPQTDEHKRSGQSGRRGGESEQADGFGPVAGVLRAQSALGDNGHAVNQQHNVAAQLSFFLQCNGESDTANWRCSESAELRLLSVIPNRDPFVR
ncbi:conserved hypothetical protein [Culex quinquefasciatus]|uniref:Uncharacterized protein n=1 Tax=Culex quinquefasciatus TaxID=7176 RepID=B0WKW2_CULQU|nr:conserved hypothetical protein [Culex quinquefasciatus]|eukprot:XP_001849346.1 conserved hypothetical protein [Culex quinquefasciatus]